MTAPTQNRPAESVPPNQRLMSVDALRGFDMFWIIGADSLIYALHRMSQTELTKRLADQLEHAEWRGFHFYDLIYATTNRVAGKFDQGLNLANQIDFEYLPGRKYDTFFDPEGCLSTIPAVATCLLGVFAGLLLRNQSLQGTQKVVWLVAFGVAGVALGWLWDAQFPVIKKTWTSSCVLVAGG